MELLYTTYCDLVGRPLPARRQQQYKGVKWICWRRDLQSALYYWRRGDLTLTDWWRSWRGRKACALFSWVDPAPFLCDLRKAAGQFLVAGVRRFRFNVREPRAVRGSGAPAPRLTAGLPFGSTVSDVGDLRSGSRRGQKTRAER